MEAHPQENTGLDASNTSSNLKKTRDASFQIGGKNVKPKMFVKRTQVKPSTRDYGTQTVVLKRTIGTQYEEQIFDEETTTKMEVDEEDDHADIEEDHSSDEDYIPSDEYEVSEEEPDNETSVQEILHADVPYKERQKEPLQKLRVRLWPCKTGLSPPVTLCY